VLYGLGHRNLQLLISPANLQGSQGGWKLDVNLGKFAPIPLWPLKLWTLPNFYISSPWMQPVQPTSLGSTTHSLAEANSHQSFKTSLLRVLFDTQTKPCAFQMCLPLAAAGDKTCSEFIQTLNLSLSPRLSTLSSSESSLVIPNTTFWTLLRTPPQFAARNKPH